MSLRKSHKSPLARKLIQLREGMGARGWTQDDSIRAMRRNRVNLSRSFIAGVEADKTDPSFGFLRACEVIYNQPPRSLTMFWAVFILDKIARKNGLTVDQLIKLARDGRKSGILPHLEGGD